MLDLFRAFVFFAGRFSYAAAALRSIKLSSGVYSNPCDVATAS
jgi:hypothetical protein